MTKNSQENSCVDSALLENGKIKAPIKVGTGLAKSSTQLGHSKLSRFEVVARREICELGSEDLRLDASVSSDTLLIITSPSVPRRVVPLQIIECSPSRVSPERQAQKTRFSKCAEPTCRRSNSCSESTFRLPHFTAATPNVRERDSRHVGGESDSRSNLQADEHNPENLSQTKKVGDLLVPCFSKEISALNPVGMKSGLHSTNKDERPPKMIAFSWNGPFVSRPCLPLRANASSTDQSTLKKLPEKIRENNGKSSSANGAIVSQQKSQSQVASFLPKTLSMLVPPAGFCWNDFPGTELRALPFDQAFISFPSPQLEMPSDVGLRSESTAGYSIDESRVITTSFALQNHSVASPKHRLEDEDEMTSILARKKSPRYGTPVNSDRLRSSESEEAKEGFSTPIEQMWPHLTTPPALQPVLS